MPDILFGIICAGIAVRLGAIGLGMMRFNRYLARARFVPAAFAGAKERVGVRADVFVSEELKRTRDVRRVPARGAGSGALDRE